MNSTSTSFTSPLAPSKPGFHHWELARQPLGQLPEAAQIEALHQQFLQQQAVKNCIQACPILIAELDALLQAGPRLSLRRIIKVAEMTRNSFLQANLSAVTLLQRLQEETSGSLRKSAIVGMMDLQSGVLMAVDFLAAQPEIAHFELEELRDYLLLMKWSVIRFLHHMQVMRLLSQPLPTDKKFRGSDNWKALEAEFRQLYPQPAEISFAPAQLTAYPFVHWQLCACILAEICLNVLQTTEQTGHLHFSIQPEPVSSSTTSAANFRSMTIAIQSKGYGVNQELAAILNGEISQAKNELIDWQVYHLRRLARLHQASLQINATAPNELQLFLTLH
jgi:hypothetical protein